jgi:vancomycin resistance protein YoaR
VARSTRRDRRPRPESEGGRVVAYLVLGLALLAGCLYVGAYLGASDKIPVGTRVAGVDIGGHSPGSAVTALKDGLADRATASFTVDLDGRTQQVRPGQAGLGIDYVASVRRAATGKSWSPTRLWGYYTDGGQLDPVVTMDQLRMKRLVKRLDITDGRPPVDGSVVFRHDDFVTRAPVPGLALDPRATAQAFWNAYLSDDPSLQLQFTPQPPAIDTAAVHRFVSHFANPALASAVVLSFGHTTLRLQPASYARVLGSRPEGNRLVPTVDAVALSGVVERRLRQGGPSNAPVNATVALVGGRPQVVKARPGVTFQPADVGHALLRAIRAPDRKARVPASLAPASFTNADARKLQIHDQVSWFTVDLPKASPSQQLMAAAVRLDNTVLEPGDTFSLRQALGSGVPGGARGTALATALFNAAWLAGLPVGAHATLPSYTGQFPVGRDASLSDGQDLVFTNDTTYGVLISVEAGRPTRQHRGSLVVTMWSTPVFDVTSSHGDPTGVVPAPTVERHGKHCHDSAGSDGFDVQVTRTFATRDTGAVDHQTTYSVHYEPTTAVVCTRHRH